MFWQTAEQIRNLELLLNIHHSRTKIMETNRDGYAVSVQLKLAF